MRPFWCPRVHLVTTASPNGWRVSGERKRVRCTRLLGTGATALAARPLTQ